MGRPKSIAAEIEIENLQHRKIAWRLCPRFSRASMIACIDRTNIGVRKIQRLFWRLRATPDLTLLAGNFMQRVMRAVNTAQPHSIAETVGHSAPDDIKTFLRAQNPRMASDCFQRGKNFASNRTAMPGLRIQACSIEPEAAGHEPVRPVYFIVPLTEAHRLFNQQITCNRLNISGDCGGPFHA